MPATPVELLTEIRRELQDLPERLAKSLDRRDWRQEQAPRQGSRPAEKESPPVTGKPEVVKHFGQQLGPRDIEEAKKGSAQQKKPFEWSGLFGSEPAARGVGAGERNMQESRRHTTETVGFMPSAPLGRDSFSQYAQARYAGQQKPGGGGADAQVPHLLRDIVRAIREQRQSTAGARREVSSSSVRPPEPAYVASSPSVHVSTKPASGAGGGGTRDGQRFIR